jgi:hypothetical protein
LKNIKLLIEKQSVKKTILPSKYFHPNHNPSSLPTFSGGCHLGPVTRKVFKMECHPVEVMITTVVFTSCAAYSGFGLLSPKFIP